MTVQELVDLLQQQDPLKEVVYKHSSDTTFCQKLETMIIKDKYVALCTTNKYYPTMDSVVDKISESINSLKRKIDENNG